MAGREPAVDDPPTIGVLANANAPLVIGLELDGAIVTMVGNCIGSNTVAYPGCQNGGTLTLTGNIINGKIGLGVQNSYANAFYYTPAAANYILSAKDSSYTLGTINGHATLMPTDPGASNVKTGVVYGPNTGTYSAGATVSANGGW